MTAFVILLVLVGLIASLIGSVMFLIAAFRESVGWGLAVMFIPFASLVFMVKFWDEVKQSVAISFAGGALCVVAVLLVPDRDATTAPAVTREPSPVERSTAENVNPTTVPSADAALLVRSEEQYYPAPAVPAPAPSQHVDEGPAPILAQVYADGVTRQYYSADCKSRPENSFRIPKQIAERQGYTEAACQ